MILNEAMLGFLWPTNLISQGVVAAIVILFAIFLVLRFRSKQHIAISCSVLKAFDSDEAIGLLVDAAHNQRKKTESNPDIEFKQIVSLIIEYSTDSNIKSGAAKEGEQHASNYEKIRNNPIIKHLKSIYVAGCNESRLETDALLHYTENELFNETFRLKNILASFIVIGLLGTLIGLGESLSQLSPVLNAGVQKADIASSLAGLLTHLKSAFAPSVWGILCTILGMFFYIRFVHTYCNPLQSKLEHLTLNVWIPRLYPGISQKLIEALTDNTTRFVEHVKDAAAVAGFAKEVREETGAFKTSLRDGQTLLEQLTSHIAQFQTASQGLSSFSFAFERSVQNLTGFQSELLQLQQDLSGSIKHAVDFQNSRIEGLYNHMMEVSKTLHIVDKTYAENVVEFNELVGSVKHGKNVESQKNREISETILKESSLRFEQIEISMFNSSLKLTENLEKSLKSIFDKFDSQDTPIKNAAVKIEKSADNIDNYHLRLAKQLIQNNDTLSTHLQLIAKQIKENNEVFISKMTDKVENTSSQNEISRQLIKEIRLLNESINQPFWNKYMPAKAQR